MSVRECRICGCTEATPCIYVEASNYDRARACGWLSDDPEHPDYDACTACAMEDVTDEENELPGQDDEPLVRIYTEGEANAAIRAVSAGGRY